MVWLEILLWRQQLSYLGDLDGDAPLRPAPAVARRCAGRASVVAPSCLSGGSRLARKPIIGRADSIFAVAPLKSAYDEVRPCYLLKVVDECVVHRRATNCANKGHGLRRQLLRDNNAEAGCDLCNQSNEHRRAFG